MSGSDHARATPEDWLRRHPFVRLLVVTIVVLAIAALLRDL
jgi:hypothetical protein